VDSVGGQEPRYFQPALTNAGHGGGRRLFVESTLDFVGVSPTSDGSEEATQGRAFSPQRKK